MPPAPPRPASYSPTGLPPGDQFELGLVSFHASRPKLAQRARLIVVHTNAANGEGNLDQASRWAEAAPGRNTCPTWSVERSGQARRMVASDRRSIANATRDDVQGPWGDVATWSLSIETADLGWGPGRPGEANVFTPAQGESVARIIAYEAWGNDFPVEVPHEWFAPDGGVATHTWPFPYPYYTLHNGKTCPGREKKRQCREWIFPRAAEIVAAWREQPAPTKPTQEDDMLIVRLDGRDEHYLTNRVIKTWVPDSATIAALKFMAGPDFEVVTVPLNALVAFGPIVGPRPPGIDDYGRPTG